MAKISVVCPTFNSAKFIEATLATILTQTRPPDELVISDDGSSDNTAEVVERYLSEQKPVFPWRVLRNKHRGPGAARNAGIREAKAEWIAFLDSDDLWDAIKLERMIECIQAHPAVNFFSHDEWCIKTTGCRRKLEYGLRYSPDRPFPPQLYFANMFSTSAVTCSRELLMNHGGFDESLMSAQDYELWLRLSPSIRPLFLRETLGCYVERKGNITSTNLLKRMSNELRIAWMHRSIASPTFFVVRIARITLSFITQYISSSRS